MQLGFIGLGHVGLVSLCGFAQLGYTCIGYDRDDVIKRLSLNDLPFFEPQLEDLFSKNSDRIQLTSNPDELCRTDIVFICVNTPLTNTGNIDCSNLFAAVEMLIAHANHNMTIIGKSTVPVGTYTHVAKMLSLSKHNLSIAFCPEFLREGAAVSDFFSPDRFVVGCNSLEARRVIAELFSYANVPLYEMNLQSAEIVKQASNTFLAMKISFINLISDFCEKTGGCIDDVEKAVGADSRIGQGHLHAGMGFGGSCFPKDIASIQWQMTQNGIDSQLINAIQNINTIRLIRIFKFLESNQMLSNTTSVTVFGVAFKKKTNDIRSSQAVELIQLILPHVLKVHVYDPYTDTSPLNDSKIVCFKDMYEAVNGSKILLVLNDEDEFIHCDYIQISKLMDTNPILIDAKNSLSICKERSLFQYYSFGNHNCGANM